MKKWPLRIIYYLTGALLLSSIHCTIVALVNGGDAKTFLYSIIYLPVVILLSEAQKRMKYFWQFGVVSVLAAVLVHFVSRSAFEQTLSKVLTVTAIFLYFYARAKQTECILETPAYPFLGVYIVMFFLERQYPSVLLEKYAVIGAGFYCLLCMCKVNLDQILQIIDLNGELERFPEKRLLQSNLVMMGFQTIIVGMGMVIFLSTGADGLLDKVVNIIRRFLAWILSFLESDVTTAGGNTSGGTAQMPVAEAAERSAFMEMLLELFDYLAWVLVIGLTIYFLYRLLRKLYQLYLDFDANSVENGDEIERIYTGNTKEEKKKLRKERVENLRWDRTPNAQIRKLYKKRILRDLQKRPSISMTPSEIETNIEMSADKKHVFHSIYEQARYGHIECTKEDVEQMKKI